jgi:hypothetical protein
MTKFAFDIRRLTDVEADGPHRVSIHAHGVMLTRVLRPDVPEPDDAAEVPPARLAFWLVDNWWRLRWEPVPAAGMLGAWRLAHDLGALGGGYAWPRITIWGEGERIGVAARSDVPGVVGPVRYLTDALIYVPASAFETAIDRFLAMVVDAQTGFGSDRSALKAQVDALEEERRDPEIAMWRSVEARLGFDLDEAPEKVMQDLSRLEERYGAKAIEEAAAAAPGADAARTLESEIEAAETAGIDCDLSAVAASSFGDEEDQSSEEAPSPHHLWKLEAPWMKAERAARRLRRRLGLDDGPIKNRSLSELLGIRMEALRTMHPTTGSALPYGLRLAAPGKSRVALRARRSHDRRFEFARVLADAIYAADERLGLIATSKTARQKFQRAFAQSLLCPYEDLVAYLGTDEPTDGDMSAAAAHFHVSERVIRTVLVNKKVISRERIEITPSMISETGRFEDVLDAA